MRMTLVSSLLFAVASGIQVVIDTATADVTSQATCIPYTSVPAPTTVTETYGEQLTLTLVDTETLGPQTDEATTTQPDETATTVLTLEPETFTVSITPTRTVTVTVTPDPERQTEVNTKTVIQTDVSTTTETVYYSNLARRDIADETGTIIKPTDIPSYASACADPQQYSSACACLGIEVTTIEAAGSPEIVTVNPRPATVTQVETATRPAVTITTTLPVKTRTVTVTLPVPDVTESTTLEATTVAVSTTADQDTVITTVEATQVDHTSVAATETRSVGPICSTYTPADNCKCKFEVICSQAVSLDSATFFSSIDFNKRVGSFEECMNRCDSNPSCQFGDFAQLPGGGLCSSYSRNPGLSNALPAELFGEISESEE
ncbi:hypothetical protein FSPOR_9196 [Fusarium sporotrichioides]|uniref:Apple domain-containing protein n=1 Tax=Fusarium sporotrichioides TaxID=5514 RepID=A0A395RR63_FUSSP|nr:hypothetical protein FSPOR_9196 [Fusarium sporotrichioides]